MNRLAVIVVCAVLALTQANESSVELMAEGRRLAWRTANPMHRNPISKKAPPQTIPGQTIPYMEKRAQSFEPIPQPAAVTGGYSEEQLAFLRRKQEQLGGVSSAAFESAPMTQNAPVSQMTSAVEGSDWTGTNPIHRNPIHYNPYHRRPGVVAQTAPAMENAASSAYSAPAPASGGLSGYSEEQLDFLRRSGKLAETSPDVSGMSTFVLLGLLAFSAVTIATLRFRRKDSTATDYFLAA